MSSSISDDNVQEPEPTDRAEQETREQGEEFWSEPAVQAQAIFRDLYRAGGKNEDELLQTLSANSTSMGWLDYWARQGFINEVISSNERKFVLSQRAILELELG